MTKLLWLVPVFACLASGGCSSNAIGGGGVQGDVFGILGSAWDVNFSSGLRGQLSSTGRNATFVLADSREGQALEEWDSNSGAFRPIDCRRVVSRAELGLYYSNEGGRFVITVVNVRQYAGAACEAAGYTVTSAPERRPSDGYTAVRVSASSSSYGDLGGSWRLLDGRNREACTINAAGSSFSGVCGSYTFQGVFSGAMVAGNDGSRGSFVGAQR